MTQVFYRKYRPQKFEEVVGQAGTINILRNAILMKRVAHAYLFSGPRGTGKTTVARILAREVGCANEDIVEIDAASSRGIDEARELREAVRVLPLRSPYKVYIIDEVHMLTREAFNALLKTLEEPPEHTIFILATTELHKVPDTVVSRTQHFPFSKIPIPDITGELKKIAAKEDLKADDDAVKLIAFFADGSLRDAENILFQFASLGDKEIKEKDIRTLLGAPAEEAVSELAKTVLQKDIGKALEIYDKILESGVEPKLLGRLLVRNFRAALFLALDLKTEQILEHEFSQDEISFFKTLSPAGAPKLEFAVKSLLEALYMPVDDSTAHLPLELALIKIANFK